MEQLITGLAVLLSLFNSCFAQQYQPTWDSLDTRPAPTWFAEARVGIFLHWGVFSVPAFQSEWFWMQWHSGDAGAVDFMKKNYPPTWTYADFAPEFRAENFDPYKWAQIFEKAGAKYVVLTSKHHEGYTLWPSKTAFNWNSMDVGPKQDLVGELSKAVRSKDIRFGVYHSMMDWFHPYYLQDKANNWTTQKFVETKCSNELRELVENYQPDILWSDGEWEAPADYWNSTHFLAWLYNESPVKDSILVNDRWGKETRCKHGDFLNCDDKYNPGKVQQHIWENCMTMDKNSWGYRKAMSLADVLTIEELLATLAETVSCNGNILINVGPRSDGTIDPLFEERLTQLGEWLNLNGEAVYASKPWTCQQDSMNSGAWYTQNNDNVYAMINPWPETGRISLGCFNISSLPTKAVVTLIGNDTPLTVDRMANEVTVHLPSVTPADKPKFVPVLKFSSLS